MHTRMYYLNLLSGLKNKVGSIKPVLPDVVQEFLCHETNIREKLNAMLFFLLSGFVGVLY